MKEVEAEEHVMSEESNDEGTLLRVGCDWMRASKNKQTPLAQVHTQVATCKQSDILPTSLQINYSCTRATNFK